ncbi:hypothetical protein Verru16b_00521 [Lacunisphaera limnophila]|uniref:DUF1570 domain-containing protein n=1 Tax=Lacunisphaera limnophila TaxID=1838286 RepID=A0A1D8ARG9_9BACT|nr:hypothetical protein [Lacunisphaera limnophila]AOS43476.1 hypothetical protein Verru16b_00521 [Lacunisphaera limnophila]
MKPALLSAVILLLAGLPGLATEPDLLPDRARVSNPHDPLILPPVVVTGDFPTKGWLYARSGRTEILSQLRARETRDLLDDFLVFQDFVHAHFPEAALPADQPVTVVLCENTKTFRLFGGEADRTSSARSGTRPVILIDAAEARHVERSLRRRSVALAFERSPLGRYPLWRQYGTREILARVVIGRQRLELGLSHAHSFGPQRGPDLARLLALTPAALAAAERNGEPVLDAYHHATLFMHMCLFGSTRPYRDLRDPYQTFIRRLETEPLSEELFRACFGRDFAEMNTLLQTYSTGGAKVKFESRHYRFPPGPPLEIRPARAADLSSLFASTHARPQTGPASEAIPP